MQIVYIIIAIAGISSLISVLFVIYDIFTKNKLFKSNQNLSYAKNRTIRFIVVAMIIIIISIGSILLPIVISSNLHPSPTPTPSPPLSTCHFPTSQQVSEWMKVTVSQVPGESCAFRIDGHGAHLSGVICTNQAGGTTIEYIPVNPPKTLVVRDCDESHLPDILALTIRFVKWYPSGEASTCTIARNERNKLPGWTIQAKC